MSHTFQQKMIRSALTTTLGAAGLLAAAAIPAKADVFHTTFEAAGAQSANIAALCANIGSGTCTIGTESFNTRTSGNSFTTNFGITGTTTIQGTYSPVQINDQDQYGGASANGSVGSAAIGKYAVAFPSTPYSVSLTTNLASGINYFGFWLSALDGGNQVDFYKKNVLVYNFTPTNLIAALGSCTNANPYCGNPTSTHAGANSGQLYAFVNFFDTSGTFDSVRFRENPADGGYESDNHTVGFTTKETGTPVDIPEPAALTIFGVALLSFGMVRRIQG